jgi:hypothetical protein
MKPRYEKCGGTLLYRKTDSGKFYARLHRIERGTMPGESKAIAHTKIVIPGTTETAARRNLNNLLDQYDTWRRTRGQKAENPFAIAKTAPTVSDLAKAYEAAGMPTRSGDPRQGKQLAEARRRGRYLVEQLGKIPSNQLTKEHWTTYANSRLQSPSRGGTCARAIDLEFHHLRCMYRYSALEFPIARITYRKTSQVRHARDVMPASGAELHAIAEQLFRGGPAGEPLGWLMLYQAKIGHRIETMLELRRDAKPGEPGFIERTDKGIPKILYLVRRRSHKGTYGHRRIDAELRDLIEAHFAWLDERHSGGPWYFPSAADPTKHVHKDSLTAAEERSCKALEIPKRTSHGNRAFSINCLRSDRTPDGFQKIPDAEIAILHGQKSAKEIIEVYGDAPPDRLTWKPQTRPYAWHSLKLGRVVQLELGI